MQMLTKHIQINTDESLESFLLRLCRANYFDSFYDFAIELKYLLQEHYTELAGSLPAELGWINIYHAQQDSGRRSQALLLVEKMLELKPFSLLDIAFKHGASIDLLQRATVRYKDHLIPRHYLRQQSIPICPKCLQEDQPFIRYLWHLKPVVACLDHNCKLVEHCPQCTEALNYMESELITHCNCGFDLRECDLQPTGTESYWIQDPGAFSVFGNCSFSEKLAVLSLFEKLIPNRNHGELLRESFDCLSELLEERISEQSELATKPFSSLPFRTISAKFIDEFTSVPNLPYGLISGVIKGILLRGLDTSKRLQGNLGDTLLSIQETAFLLQSTINDVYRLYETGTLNPAIRLASDKSLTSYYPVFRLQDVAILVLSCSSFAAITSAK